MEGQDLHGGSWPREGDGVVEKQALDVGGFSGPGWMKDSLDPGSNVDERLERSHSLSFRQIGAQGMFLQAHRSAY